MWPACKRPRAPSRQAKGANAGLELGRGLQGGVTVWSNSFNQDALLRRLPPRSLSLGLLRTAIRDAGQQMSDESKRVRVVERPEKATIKAATVQVFVVFLPTRPGTARHL